MLEKVLRRTATRNKHCFRLVYMSTELKIEDRDEALKKIKDEVLALKSSPLYAERIKNNVFPVIGEGSHFAKIMFVGEAPGRNEAKSGRPFFGAAGKILNELLESVGVKREDVYITNIVKDRPPQNRDPLPEEIESYGPFLDRQIEIIQPKVIATLGRYSMVYIMQKFGLTGRLESISQAHGKWYEAAAGYGMVTIIPLYHPAAAIYNQLLKDTLKKDFQIIKKYAEK
jgi:DNA polymerase